MTRREEPEAEWGRMAAEAEQEDAAGAPGDVLDNTPEEEPILLK